QRLELRHGGNDHQFSVRAEISIVWLVGKCATAKARQPSLLTCYQACMGSPIELALADEIALMGVAVGLLAIVVAVWCVNLSLKSSLRVNTLLEIRDDLVRTLDGIEALLREID